MKIKGFFSLVLAAALALGLAVPAAAEGASPVVTDCEAYIVTERGTGQVLIEKNADEVLYPASITKIMILGLACEKAQGNWDTMLTVTEDEMNAMENGAAHIALRPGEEVRLEDMLYATCLSSACDAANMLATYVGGSIEGGVQAMNDKAQQLGLTDTHFSNPTGLHNEQLYTTARDMAVITRWALQQPGFETVFCYEDTWTMKPTNIQPKERYFSHSDYTRWESYQVYRPYMKGSKSGWHDQALYTQVNYAEQDGVELIFVVLHANTRNSKFDDLVNLGDYCFSNFHRRTVSLQNRQTQIPVWGGGEKLGNITLTSPETVDLLLADGVSPDALQTEFTLPEYYVLGTPFTPTLAVTLQGQGLQSDSTATIPARVSGLDTLLAANTYNRLLNDSHRQKLGSWFAVAVVAALVALILFRLRRAPVKPGLMQSQPIILATRRPDGTYESRTLRPTVGKAKPASTTRRSSGNHTPLPRGPRK